MAGTINFAMTQQFDDDGRPLSGGLLYFFQAGTTTPQNAFQDEALTIVHPNPITLDAGGRVPMFYLADGNIKIRLTTELGVTVIAADNLLVIGPSTTGGGSSNVDPTTILATGDIKARYGTGPLTGYAILNGTSIGKSGSGASQIAHDTIPQALFEYLWQFPNITLNTAKGASANADFLAGRQLNLPDLRGRVIAGLDTMGTTAAGRLTSFGFLGDDPTELGEANGSEGMILLDPGQAPPHSHPININTDAQTADHTHTTGGPTGTHTHSGTTGQDTPAHTHGATTDTTGSQHQHNIDIAAAGTNVGAGGINVMTPGGNTVTDNDSLSQHTHGASVTGGLHTHPFTTGVQIGDTHTHTTNSITSTSHSHLISDDTDETGASEPFPLVQPSMVMTFYIKL